MLRIRAVVNKFIQAHMDFGTVAIGLCRTVSSLVPSRKNWRKSPSGNIVHPVFTARVALVDPNENLALKACSVVGLRKIKICA